MAPRYRQPTNTREENETMTRRERLQRELEKRQEWADKARQRAEQRDRASHAAVDGIPFGQPILVGHHSEKRHRKALHRAQTNATKAYEERQLAGHHASKAGGLARALESSIFSDDANAIEQLAARIAENEQLRESMTASNKWWRKHKTMKGCPGWSDERAAAMDREMPQRYSWEQKGPYAPFELSNLGGRITADRKRLEHIRRTQQARAEADAAGGTTVKALTNGQDYAVVTFAERPDRATLDELRAAGFRWSNPSWYGPTSRLPADLAALAIPYEAPK